MKTDEYGVKYSNNGKILYEFPNDLEGEYIIPEGVKEIKKYALDCRPYNVYPKLSSLRISLASLVIVPLREMLRISTLLLLRLMVLSSASFTLTATRARA